MARKLRTSPAGIPQHIHRLSRPALSALPDDEDKAVYLKALANYATRYQVAVHAWGMSDSQLQLLVTPKTDGGISSMLQATGRIYAQHYNQKYAHRGGIWQDRYKASLILADDYLIAVYRYIDRLLFVEGSTIPHVAANAANEPITADTKKAIGSHSLHAQPRGWSSAYENQHGASTALLTPHSRYIALGDTPQDRQQAYQQLFSNVLPEAQLADIRKALKMSLALGDEHFIKRLEQVIGRRLLAGKPGRPKKAPLQKNAIGPAVSQAASA
ncbi:transposase [Salinimonas sediminis]|uniref:Transposase IS200-like domain-containing protein n=1 Tax=Salinimonas sediminis TaxID=2303538 RepID=A0A346NHI2_9ALTE|nr:transposase [Salinimonas sediminis]AXR04989.1 hypothetical protein D0Y50_00560 [Salinimonas sediminis]